MGKDSKDAMPFVQFVKEKVQADGGKFNLTESAEFDQKWVLENVLQYLLDTLQLKQIKFIDVLSDQTPPEIVRTCSPGFPTIMYDFQ